MNVTLEMPNMPGDVLNGLRRRAVHEGKPINEVALSILAEAIVPLNKVTPAVRITSARPTGRKQKGARHSA